MNSKFSKKKTEFAFKELYPESNMHPSDEYKNLKLKTTNIKNLPVKQTSEINSSKPHLRIFPDKIMSDEPDSLLEKKNDNHQKTKKKTKFAFKELYPESNMHPSDDYKNLKLKTTNIKNPPLTQTGEINSSKNANNQKTNKK